VGEMTPVERGEMIPRDALAETISAMMTPLLSQMAEIISRTNTAMEQIAAAQRMQSERMSELERQIRMQVTLTAAQVKYLNQEIRKAAEGILAVYGADDAAAVRKLGGCIRKYVCAMYGVGSVREIPKCDYGAAMQLAQRWMDADRVAEIVREARERKTNGKADDHQ